jgi:hypothetical protein
VYLLVLFAVVSNLLVQITCSHLSCDIAIPAHFENSLYCCPNGTLYRPQTSFHGVCIDTGAQKTVIGIHQAIAYCHMIGIPFNPRRSAHSFRFDSDVQRGLGTIPIRIPTANGAILPAQVDVVNTDIPFLLRQEFLKKESLYADTVDDTLVCKSGKWQVPLEHKFGHMYYDWSETPNSIYKV